MKHELFKNATGTVAMTLLSAVALTALLQCAKAPSPPRCPCTGKDGGVTAPSIGMALPDMSLDAFHDGSLRKMKPGEKGK